MGLILGLMVGVSYASYLYYRHVFSKITDTSADRLAHRIATLSKLRLEEFDVAITDLEKGVDDDILFITQTPYVPVNNYRRSALRMAKTYRDIYPFSSEVAESLKDIQRIEIFNCDSPLSRLVKREEEKRPWKRVRSSPGR